MNNLEFGVLKESRGHAFLELALVLPLLFMLVFGVLEYGRALQANNIIVNMSREGANLAARSQDSPQDIMDALATTADPLDMAQHGMMFITEIVGRMDEDTNTEVVPEVNAQYRWTGSSYDATSKVWGDCPSWDGGTCDIPDEQFIADLGSMGTEIGLGETVYAVEVFYNHQIIISYVMKDAPELYSRTVF